MTLSPTTTDRNDLDAYYTPPALTRVLLDHLDRGWGVDVDIDEDGTRRRVIAEPCAGDNWISRVLRTRGFQVVTGDIDPTAPVDYPDCDFFSTQAGRVYEGADAVITNPPYSGAPRYVRRALELADHVAMLLRLSFLEPCESRPESARADLLQDLSRVIVLPRVSFYQGKSGTDSVTCAWFVWSPRGGSTGLDVVTEGQLERAAGQEDLFSGGAT